jgi:hypothetical protein
MKSEAKQRWLKTGVNNLVRHHKSKAYYARFKVNGKQVWRSLRTPLKEVAKARLIELLENERAARDNEHGQRNRWGKRGFLSQLVREIRNGPKFSCAA